MFNRVCILRPLDAAEKVHSIGSLKGTCAVFQKEYVCAHALGVSIKLKTVAAEHLKQMPMARTGRGHPKKSHPRSAQPAARAWGLREPRVLGKPGGG